MRRDERKRTGARGVSNHRQETIMPGYLTDEEEQLMTEIFDRFSEHFETEDSDLVIAATIDHLLRHKQ
jgi:hypothetical protein